MTDNAALFKIIKQKLNHDDRKTGYRRDFLFLIAKIQSCADGVRIGKSGAKTATYTVCGTQILSESSGSNTTYYLYDESGSPVGLTYKGTTYYYRKNLQGDIINITDSTGAKVVTYTYNAWGKIMSMTGNMELAVNNPFRY